MMKRLLGVAVWMAFVCSPFRSAAAMGVQASSILFATYAPEFVSGALVRAQLDFPMEGFTVGAVLQHETVNGTDWYTQGHMAGGGVTTTVGDARMLVGGVSGTKWLPAAPFEFGVRGDLLIKSYLSPMDEEAYETHVLPHYGFEPTLGLTALLLYVGGGLDIRMPFFGNGNGLFLAADAGIQGPLGLSTAGRFGYYATR
jgi:hypothetical protein